jgi:hypothetical protein
MCFPVAPNGSNRLVVSPDGKSVTDGPFNWIAADMATWVHLRCVCVCVCVCVSLVCVATKANEIIRGVHACSVSARRAQRISDQPSDAQGERGTAAFDP